MASFSYANFNHGLGLGLFNFSTDSFKAVLVDEGLYTPVQATDTFLADIPLGARIVTTPTLTGVTYAGGVFDASDVNLTAVTGASIESVILYKDTGVEGTSRLIVRYDNFSGLAFSPTGGNLVILWPQTQARILKIG